MLSAQRWLSFTGVKDLSILSKVTSNKKRSLNLSPALFCGEFWIPSFPCFGLKSKSTVYNLAIFHLLHFPSIFQVIPTSEMMKKKFLHTIPLLRLLFSR